MNLFYRYQIFLRKPWRDKAISVRLRFKTLWLQLFASIPLPIRLPYGGWWFATNDTSSDSIFTCNFEEAEWRFVERFLKEGMTVLDIGAHHGFYTILASRKVGISGRVIGFEPSPREQRWLNINLRLNHCKNVTIEPMALSNEEGEAILYLGDWSHTVFNSLRPPSISGYVKEINIRTISLDTYVERAGIKHIDFIKIDAEGAEIEILKGANQLFNKDYHPVIMAEISNKRTEAWGYPSSDIYDFLANRGYSWFALNPEGRMIMLKEKENNWNLVAVHRERLAKLEKLIA